MVFVSSLNRVQTTRASGIRQRARAVVIENTYREDDLRSVRDKERQQGHPALHDGSVEESSGHGGHNM